MLHDITFFLVNITWYLIERYCCHMLALRSLL